MEEHKIRDLNDRINKLFREKWHWNNRIKELGGPDFRVLLFEYCLTSSQRSDLVASQEGPSLESGKEGAIRAPGGYYYFGAAKNLPGVAELLAPKGALLPSLQLLLRFSSFILLFL